MTTETIADLRSNIRVGFTEKRGTAWWANPEHRMESHFEGPVPMHVAEELIGWEPLEGPIQSPILTDHGVTTVTDPDKKMYVNPRTMKPVGVVGEGHAKHSYGETLLRTAARITDSELGIGSVGYLKGGARAFVQYEFNENITAGKDVEFRPFLTAATSLDGSLSTTFLTGAQVVVCDNTLSLALGSAADTYKVRHTRHSRVNVTDARTALNIVFNAAEQFQAEVDKLTSEYVSDQKWNAFIEKLVAKPELPGRAMTIAENKIATLNQLWKTDERVAPWKNSAWGVLAATNTWANHLQSVKNMSRSERNVGKLIDGSFEKGDQMTLALLATV